MIWTCENFASGRRDAEATQDLPSLIDRALKGEPDAPVGAYGYVGIKEYIASLFDGRLDVVDRESLKPYVRPVVTAEAVYAF